MSETSTGHPVSGDVLSQPSRNVCKPKGAPGRPPEGGTLSIPTRRGPRSRFMTKTQLEDEKATIISMLANGATAKDVAAAMDVSVATLYRRIGKKTGKEATVKKISSPTFNTALRALLTSIELELARTTALLAKRSTRTIHKHSCCRDCHNDMIALRLLEASNRQVSLYMRLLQNIGYFEEAKKRANGMWVLKQLSDRSAAAFLRKYINALEAGESFDAEVSGENGNTKCPPPLQLHTVQHIIDVVGTDGLHSILQASTEIPEDKEKAKSNHQTKH